MSNTRTTPQLSNEAIGLIFNGLMISINQCNYQAFKSLVADLQSQNIEWINGGNQLKGSLAVTYWRGSPLRYAITEHDRYYCKAEIKLKMINDLIDLGAVLNYEGHSLLYYVATSNSHFKYEQITEILHKLISKGVTIEEDEIKAVKAHYAFANANFYTMCHFPSYEYGVKLFLQEEIQAILAILDCAKVVPKVEAGVDADIGIYNSSLNMSYSRR